MGYVKLRSNQLVVWYFVILGRQFFKLQSVMNICTTRRMAEQSKALCYYQFPRYDAGAISGQGFSAFLHFLQISQTFRANIFFQATIGNTKLFALIVVFLKYLQMISYTTAHCNLLKKLRLKVADLYCKNHSICSQRFKSHTFQHDFGPLKFLKLL